MKNELKTLPRCVISVSLLIIVGLVGCKPSEILPPGCNPDVSGSLKKGTAPATTPTTDHDEKTTFVLNPESLREEVLIKNTGLLLEANNVHRAKDNVAIARGNLLPSLNLGALLFSTTQKSFILSSVEVLLPFLVPSKWFDYYKSKHLVSAEVASLDILRANTYSSALALYFSALSDQGLWSILNDDVSDLAEIEAFSEFAYQTGVGSQEDWLRVKAQRAMSEVSASKIEELLGTEKEHIRHALQLGSHAELQLEAASINPSDWEDKSAQELADQALANSLERTQLQELEKAAKLDHWSKIFGFVSSAGMKAGAGSDGSPSFSNVYGAENFSIGFATVPTVHLSQRNIEDLKLREKELEAELLEVSANNLESLKQGAGRETLAREAWDALSQVVEKKKLEYLGGVGGIVPYLQARAQLRQAAVEVLRAQILLTQDRIVLHRTLRTDLFSIIPSCMPKQVAKLK